MQGSDAGSCRVIRGSLSEKVTFDGRDYDIKLFGQGNESPK